MQVQGAAMVYHLLHKDRPYHDGSLESWVAEPSRTHPFHMEAGVNFWASRHDLTPDDDFLGQSVPEEVPGEHPEGEDS